METVLCNSSRDQLDPADSLIRAARHLLHQRNQSLALNHLALIFDSSHKCRRIFGHPIGGSHHHTIRHPEDFTDLVRSDLPQMGCAMVVDRASLHHHRLVRISRTSCCPPDRVSRTSGSTVDRLLLRHLQSNIVDHT